MALAPSRSRSDSPSSSDLKRAAILEAATNVFLRDGYLGTNMDSVATQAAVSKQTVYNHFASKQALFAEIVTAMCLAAGDAVFREVPDFTGGDLAEYLLDYGYRQLVTVMTPRVMQLRRLVIGEANRFPELGKAFFETGPKRAIGAIARLLEGPACQGLLTIDDPVAAAGVFNWLLMSTPLNKAMFLGDAAIPSRKELRKYAEDAVRVFLAAYGAEQTPPQCAPVGRGPARKQQGSRARPGPEPH